MEFFSGTVNHQLDGKNRIRIPAKFRSKLGKEIFFMARPDGCIGVYSKEGLEKTLAKLEGITTGNPEKLKAMRLLMGTIEEVKEDDQGRTVVSAFFRDYAKIVKDVITVGTVGCLEIWAKEAREQYLADMKMNDASVILDY